MSHNKIKAAARKRMAATGEPYAAARREAISEHSAAQLTSAISGEDVRAAAEAHRELGAEYSDAVVASFIEKVDRAVAARVEARLAETAREKPAERAGRAGRLLTRRVARDVVAAAAGALVAVGAVGLYEVTSAHEAPPAGSLPVQHVAGKSWQARLDPAGKGRRFIVVVPTSGSTHQKSPAPAPRKSQT